MKIMMFPDIRSATDIFSHFGPFLPFYPPTPQKIKILKNEKQLTNYELQVSKFWPFNTLWRVLSQVFNKKLVSTILCQIFTFAQNDNPLKTMKNVFISSKKLFSFSRYSNFCNFFPSFPHFPDPKGQVELE